VSRHLSLPYHIYVNIDNSFLGPNMPKGTTRGIWHGIYSRPFQILSCHVFLESGAHWSGLPLHALSTKNDFSYTSNELMPWASMGDNIDSTHFSYLEGLKASVFLPIKVEGRHTGIMIDWFDGYSRYPEEHKPLNLIEVANGQFVLIPNNFVTYNDKHFVNEESKENLKHYVRGDKIYWGE
jgi:hypothetical protein